MDKPERVDHNPHCPHCEREIERLCAHEFPTGELLFLKFSSVGAFSCPHCKNLLGIAYSGGRLASS